MPQVNRLPAGGRVDRSRPVAITFNGREVQGYAGDTVASLLLANGIHLVARSFKYHRPRGILGHGAEEPNALLTIERGPGRRDPNCRATTTEALPGLIVRSQNHWPSLAFDLGAVSNALSAILPAGFYYKTFMWPRGWWRALYEPSIRAAAGLGRPPAEPDPDRYAHRYAHCDVLVVGAGPAGLAAALAASEGDSSVILADEQPEPGGSLLHETAATIDGLPAQDWVAEATATLASRPNVTVLPRTTAFGYYNHNFLALAERLTDHLEAPPPHAARERLWQVRAREVVLATGAHERPLVFKDNDRPGIMLAESMRAYINRYAVAPGRRIVIATTSASSYALARDAKAAGLGVSIVDARPEPAIGPELAAIRDLGIEVLTGHAVLSSIGRRQVAGLVVAPDGPDGAAGPSRTLACDAVAMSGGWTPAVHLFSQSRGRLDFDAARDAFVPGQPMQAARPAGAANGTYDLAGCLDEGFAAGSAAARSAAKRRFVASPTWTGFVPARRSQAGGGQAFVDFQNDVTAKDIALALREGFQSIEHVKRYTTLGMATDQGKTSNMNALGLVAGALDKSIAAVGTTTYRPPYTPVTFGTLVGPGRDDLFDPVRTTPIHDWAVAQGAVFEDVGQWKRARYFPRRGEDMHQAVARECRAVRTAVGLFDGSTLGKIEVVGPDAAEFLNRIYTNALLRLETGRCRYGLMLREDGYIMDDGIVARLAPDRFHVTTTTGGAARVLAHMEDYLQTEWPHLEVFLTSITEQYAVIAVQGPKSREVLAPLVSGIDLSNAACPHMSVRTGRIAGVPCRLFRVSFTGEAGYEVNVPADYGRGVWEAVWQRGQAFGITPYGTEAMHVLRAERGFIIVGQETDGTVTPDDVGLSGLIGRSKADFVGKRSLARPDLVSADRKQLVGLLTENPQEVLEEGAQIVETRDQPRPMKMVGHVTSSYWSANCNRSIALALVSGGRTRMGTRVFVTTPGGFTPAHVVEPAFVDPKGERVHG
jgi:sarcosine oxidase subunit alpha